MAEEGKMAELKGKTIVLGVTGSIAAYKAPIILRGLMRLGAEVLVVMTKNATQFVTPLTFQSLSGRPVLADMFAPVTNWQIEHVSLAERADLLLIAPATANFIGKIASGIADDLLTTTVMATKAPVVIAPAMHTSMYQNPIVQANIERLRQLGYIFVEPKVGALATGAEGKGRLAEIEDITKNVVGLLKGKRRA